MESGLSRRSFISGAGLAGIALLIAPHMAQADARAVKDELTRLFGTTPMTASRVKLGLPQIAENGLVVPMHVDVASPMTETDYVKSVHVFAEGNPLPHVISCHFTPECGRASASARIRLAQTQTLIAVAEMSDGTLHMAKTHVKVTIGGCGG